MESLKGIITSDDFRSVKVPHSVSTHTAIDPNTRTASDGSLFTIEAIKKGMVYECVIDDCDTGMVYEGKVIYLGKYSSAGFGKLKITAVENMHEENLTEKINEFTEKKNDKETGKKYASVLFLSDAKLDIDRYSEGVKTSDEYRNIWTRALFGENSCISIEQIAAQNYYYNGFDTSVDGENRQHKAEYLTEMGTSFLVSFPEESKEAVSILEKFQSDGAGRDTECGYGQVSVCSDIHMTGIRED